MEKYFSGQPVEKLFEEAQVVSPFKTKDSKKGGASKSSQGPATTTHECEICCLALPKSVIVFGAS